jgi:hypothetical protein
MLRRHQWNPQYRLTVQNGLLMPTTSNRSARRKQIEAERRGLIERLPTRFRTRRGFSFLLGIVAFFGYGGWYLSQGRGVLSSLLSGVVSGLGTFLFFWWLFSREGSGFDD